MADITRNRSKLQTQAPAEEVTVAGFNVCLSQYHPTNEGLGEYHWFIVCCSAQQRLTTGHLWTMSMQGYRVTDPQPFKTS